MVWEEVGMILRMGVTEESKSEWRSLIVPKPDGLIWFCINFHKVNAISKFSAYLMLQVNELLEQLGPLRSFVRPMVPSEYW